MFKKKDTFTKIELHGSGENSPASNLQSPKDMEIIDFEKNWLQYLFIFIKIFLNNEYIYKVITFMSN